MGALDDPKLRDYHDQIQQALYWSSPPNFQKICEVLNGMSMQDMLDEAWRIKATGHLDALARFATSARGVNNDRLRAGIGAVQDQPPPDLDVLIQKLSPDQQRAIKSVRAATQAPALLNPEGWSRFYWQTRLLPIYVPPPSPSSTDADDDAGGKKGGDGGGEKDDDEAHLAADIATGLTANSPVGTNPMTYTVTAVYRNLNAFKFGNDDNELTIFHEPNASLQFSPDPNNPAAVQAAIGLFNLHLRRNWGLISPDVEFSLSAQGGVQLPSGAPNAGLQAQVELHVTTRISLTLSSSLGIGPPLRPDDPPDRGAFHFGDRSLDMSFTPFAIGILGHWDPPTK
jgi:hypothetical protein